MEDLAETQWVIVSINCYKNYIVAGSHWGHLLVYDLNTRSTIYDRKIEGDMNNCFTFHTFEDNVRLIVANNSPKHGIQVFQLPEIKPIEIIQCPNYRERTAIGSVAVSPNGHWMVALGDNAHAFLFKIKQGKYSSPKQIQLPGVCFQVSWAPNSKLFAVACEAGFCVIINCSGNIIESHPSASHDLENFSPTCHAIRSVSFSHNKDHHFLAFAQPQKHISVVSYDPEGVRQLMPKRQNIKVSGDDGRLSSIAGIDFTTNDNLAIGYSLIRNDTYFFSPTTTTTTAITPNNNATTKYSGCIALFEANHLPTLKQLCIQFIRRHFQLLYYSNHNLKNSIFFDNLPYDVKLHLFDDINDFMEQRGITHTTTTTITTTTNTI
eukprot:TRINITY_DN1990_c1_g1_i1.p1 TRINITY_DN1990_c1_g1~~TRINITY_DN1990_c1_g1_i1.p1  ORF type:complete len:415 (-),score=52.47 TRINITY_DN1990_c1_g1_i1:166-1299(-)